jgi:ornithine carbamoyltransferase
MFNGTPRHFIDLSDIDATDLRHMIDDATKRKKLLDGEAHGALDSDAPLGGHIVGLIFEKPSTRTRVSFDVGVRQLGGETLILSSSEMQLGRGETIEDTGRVLSRFVDMIMIRTTGHDKLLSLAASSSVPVINGLTDWSHPCQIMADVLTFEEHKGPIKDKIVTWVGDGNNVAISWIHAAVKFDFELRLACPASLMPSQDALDWAKANNGRISVGEDPNAAVKNADCIVTDTWVSMGDKDADVRHKVLAPFQVNADLMSKANPDAIFMHCLPAHREEEVTTEVIDGSQSVVFDEAENRLHAQKAIMVWCISA